MGELSKLKFLCATGLYGSYYDFANSGYQGKRALKLRNQQIPCVLFAICSIFTLRTVAPALKDSLRIVERNYDGGNKKKNIRKNEELERDG